MDYVAYCMYLEISKGEACDRREIPRMPVWVEPRPYDQPRSHPRAAWGDNEFRSIVVEGLVPSHFLITEQSRLAETREATRASPTASTTPHPNENNI